MTIVKMAPFPVVAKEPAEGRADARERNGTDGK